MNRRSFIRFGIVGASASVVAPSLVLAGSKGNILQTPMAGGLYYTKDAPGRWSKKVTPHLPVIEHSKGADGKLQIQVTTGHEMKQAHYIVKHTLLDQNFRFITEQLFDPTKTKAAISNFTLDAYSGPLYALSVCNKHDTWIDVVEL